MSEHPNKVAFEEGVGYVLKSWTALKLAVEQDWGGVESGEKRDWMIGIVVDYFGKRKVFFLVKRGSENSMSIK
jgi:pre-rRNA-processing protein TSR2